MTSCLRAWPGSVSTRFMATEIPQTEEKLGAEGPEAPADRPLESAVRSYRRATAASAAETWLLGPRRWRASPRRLGFRGRRLYWFALPAEAAVQRQALARSHSVPRQRNKTAKAEKQR